MTYDDIIVSPEEIPTNIPEIGPGTLAILRSEGIRTNRDLLMHFEEFKIQAIPGIGPAKAALLREWMYSTFSMEDYSRLSKFRKYRQRQQEEELRKSQSIGCIILIICGFFILLGWVLLALVAGTSVIPW